MINSVSIPMLSARAASELFEFLREQGPAKSLSARHDRPKSLKPTRVEVPPGFESSLVDQIRDQVLALAETFPFDVTKVEKSRNAFDLSLAHLLFSVLENFPQSVLMNRDFWRYLAVYELFEIGMWRYPDRGNTTWGQNFGVAGNFARCFPYKAYLRGKLIAKVRSEGLPWTDVEDVDFYDSHLFGRRNALVPGVAAALNTVRTSLPSSRALDPYATVIRQYRGTHLTELLDQGELHAVMDRYVVKQSKRRAPK